MNATTGRLAALFAPRRPVPATVEFADMSGRGGPHALPDVAAFRNADALLHVVLTDLPPLIGPLIMREIGSEFPSHQPARSAVSFTTTSARA